MRKIKYTSEYLKEIAKKYNTRSEFAKNSKYAYDKARKLGILDEICSHMNYRGYNHYSFEYIMSIAKKYYSKSKFARENFSIYQYARRHGILKKVTKHMKDMRKLIPTARKYAKEIKNAIVRHIVSSTYYFQLYRNVLQSTQKLIVQKYRDKIMQEAYRYAKVKKGFDPNDNSQVMKYIVNGTMKEEIRGMVKAVLAEIVDEEGSIIYGLPESIKEYIRREEFPPKSAFGINSRKDLTKVYLREARRIFKEFPEYIKYFGKRPIFGTKDAILYDPDMDFGFLFGKIPDLNFRLS